MKLGTITPVCAVCLTHEPSEDLVAVLEVAMGLACVSGMGSGYATARLEDAAKAGEDPYSSATAEACVQAGMKAKDGLETFVRVGPSSDDPSKYLITLYMAYPRRGVMSKDAE